MKFPLFILCSLSLLSLFSCSDDEPNYSCSDTNSVLFPEDPKERFFFKPGSYWVYENENAPGVFDSCYVTNYYSKTEPSDPERLGKINTKKCYEELYMESHSLRFGSLYTSAGVKIATEGFNYTNEYFSIVNFGIQTQNIQFCMLDLKGEEYIPENCEYNKVYITDSIDVNGQIYKDVLTIDRQPGNEGAYVSVSYAKNIGPVKMIRRDSTKWNLVRYEIMP